MRWTTAESIAFYVKETIGYVKYCWVLRKTIMLIDQKFWSLELSRDLQPQKAYVPLQLSNIFFNW